jgi:hypothetical protein
VYAKIDSVTKLPKMMAQHKVTPSVKPFTWSLGDDLNEIPDWIPYLYGKPVKTKIGECEEMSGGRTAAAKAATSGTKTGGPISNPPPPAVHANGKPQTYYEPPGAPLKPEMEEAAF